MGYQNRYPQTNSFSRPPRYNHSGYDSSRENETYIRTPQDGYVDGFYGEPPQHEYMGRYGGVECQNDNGNAQWQDPFRNDPRETPLQYRNDEAGYLDGFQDCQTNNNHVHGINPRYYQTPQQLPPNRSEYLPSVPENIEPPTPAHYCQEQQDSQMFDTKQLFYY
jgi:hypothetical protein